MKNIKMVAISFAMVVSGVNAADVNIQQYDKYVTIQNKQAYELDKKVFQIAIDTQKTVKVGEDALKSLHKNKHFIERLETDPGFKECVILQTRKESFMKDKKHASDALAEKKISQNDYAAFVKNTDKEISILDAKMSRKKCNEGGVL